MKINESFLRFQGVHPPTQRVVKQWSQPMKHEREQFLYSKEQRAQDYVYSDETVQRYGNRTTYELLSSKHIPRRGEGWSDSPKMEEGLRFYERTYEDTGNTYYRSYRPYGEMTEGELDELVNKRLEEVLNRMERIQDHPMIGVPDDPIGALMRGEDPYGPDYVNPKFWKMSESEIRQHFVDVYTMFRELDQEMTAIQDRYELEIEANTKKFEARQQMWHEQFERLKANAESPEESMRKAKQKEKQMIQSFTQKLASGQMLSAMELMQFSMIDGAALSRAMRLYEEKQQVGGRSFQYRPFEVRV